MKKSWSIVLGVLAVFYTTCNSNAAEFNYPTKTIELVLGMAPGAGTDTGARLLAENSKKFLGQEIMVVNKTGGMNRVAFTLVSKAPADGYTLGGGTDASITLAPHLEKIPYGTDSFTFISQYGKLSFGVCVLPNSPFRTVKDMVEFARANPDKLTISTLGPGGFTQTPMEALALKETIRMKLVPFPGAAPQTTALLGGHVMAASGSLSGVDTYLKAKKLRLLFVEDAERLEDYPDVPTLVESGYPTFIFNSWHVVFGPKNMDRRIVAKLAGAFKEGMKARSFIDGMKRMASYAPKPIFGDELTASMNKIDQQNRELIKLLGLTKK